MIKTLFTLTYIDVVYLCVSTCVLYIEIFQITEKQIDFCSFHHTSATLMWKSRLVPKQTLDDITNFESCIRAVRKGLYRYVLGHQRCEKRRELLKDAYYLYQWIKNWTLDLRESHLGAPRTHILIKSNY